MLFLYLIILYLFKIKKIHFFPQVVVYVFYSVDLKAACIFCGTVSKVVSAAWILEYTLPCGFKISLTLRSSSAAADPQKEQDFRVHAAGHTTCTRRCQEAFRKTQGTFTFQNKSQLPVKFLRDVGSNHPADMCSP